MTNEQLITALMQYPLDAEVTLLPEFKGGGIRLALPECPVLVAVPTWKPEFPNDNEIRG